MGLLGSFGQIQSALFILNAQHDFKLFSQVKVNTEKQSGERFTKLRPGVDVIRLTSAERQVSSPLRRPAPARYFSA